MADYRNLSEMVNTFWKKTFSVNLNPFVAAEVPVTETLNKLRLSWLFSSAPAFFLNSKQVKILHEPQSFYELLLEQIGKAQNRVVLASLYIGNGALEQTLIAALKKRLEDKPDLKVKILLDCTRGSRGKINSRKMIMPLLQKFDKSCQVSLYQTPSLRGPLVPFVPEKYKEIVGLQHMKVYLFDNNFIITGANLSNDYFTNRQDRYMFVANSSELSDFIEGLVDRVSEFSFCLNGDDKLSLCKSWPHNPFKTDPNIFNFAASTHIRNYYENFSGSERKDEDDTVVFPLIEMGPLGIHRDSETTIKILQGCNNEFFMYLTTGYFNLTQSYTSTIINESKAQLRILMAHPTIVGAPIDGVRVFLKGLPSSTQLVYENVERWRACFWRAWDPQPLWLKANGFYKAKGPAGGIPDAYTSIALKFLDKLLTSGEASRVKMLEYKRPGWTYHAKGLWLSPSEFQPPFLTMIGSPNFGERSVKRDLECQFLLATTDEGLRGELERERNFLYESCEPFTEAVAKDPERRTPFWVEVIVRLFRSYL